MSDMDAPSSIRMPGIFRFSSPNESSACRCNMTIKKLTQTLPYRPVSLTGLTWPGRAVPFRGPLVFARDAGYSSSGCQQAQLANVIQI